MYFDVILISQVPYFGESRNYPVEEEYSMYLANNFDVIENEKMNLTNSVTEMMKNIIPSTFVKENKPELIKRELSDREKVELGMKKWEKSEQKRVIYS
jgi:hypothetical protein